MQIMKTMMTMCPEDKIFEKSHLTGCHMCLLYNIISLLLYYVLLLYKNKNCYCSLS